MKKTQKDWVIAQLKEHGSVTRNQALKVYISRLATIIHDLRQDGWDIECKKKETPYGTDYEYKVSKRPTKRVSTVQIVDGKAIETFKEVEI